MSLLDFIYPKRCVGCRKMGEYVCPSCFSYIKFADGGFCTVCQRAAIGGITHPMCRKRLEIDGVFACVNYTGVVKRLIHQFKYSPYVSDLRSLLDALFYEGIIQKELFIKLLSGNSVFVPIPLYKRRMRQRGYNQSKILAEGLVKRLEEEGKARGEDGDLITAVDCLERIRETKPQFGLSQHARSENLEGAFELRQNFLKMMKGAGVVFLVDDIVTTGATLREAARVLKAAGVKKVYGAALAHG